MCALKTTDAICLTQDYPDGYGQGTSSSGASTEWDGRFVGNAWQGKNRREKLQLIWDKITEDTTSGSFYYYSNLPFEDVNERFPNYGDEKPCYTHNCIGKPVYASGNVAQIEWVSNGQHSYTGLFEGSDSAVLRIAG